MLSALIPPAGRKSAVPLAGQLTHESCVRPGPLVLGTAFLKSPTAASDRDRHSCCRWHEVPGARAFLPGSACRHADRTISSRCAFRRAVLGVWSLRILDGDLSMKATVSPTSAHLQGLLGKPMEGKPSGLRCVPRSIARSTRANVTTSSCLQLTSGFRSKKGITL